MSIPEGLADEPRTVTEKCGDFSSSSKDRGPFPGVQLRSGFNAIEDGYVWSQYRFALKFPGGVRFAVVVCQFHQPEGKLTAKCGAQQGFAYPIERESTALLIPIEEDGLLQAEVSPAVQLASDVRELGVMITAIHGFGNESECQHWAHRIGVRLRQGKKVQCDFWTTPSTSDAATILYEGAARAAIRSGWAKMAFEIKPDGSGVLHCAFYPPLRAIQVPSRYHLVMAQDQSHCATFTLANKGGPFPELPRGFFSASLNVPEHLVTSGHLDFDVLDTSTGRAAVDWQSGHWRGFGGLPVPDADNRFRVAGAVSPESFCFTGATWYVKLAQLVELLFGQSISGIKEQRAKYMWPDCRNMRVANGQVQAILDWGCGCARISRFLLERTTARVTGIDIDAQNIAWCKTNVPGARFLQVGADPPTTLRDGEFDLVIGHSVFTHLREIDQDLWLAELHRLLRPGGFALVTVMAELAWFACYSESKTYAQYLELINQGVRDAGHLNVGVDASSPGYYRNVSHTTDYVHRHWSQFFEVVGVIDGFADFQSLVILRKPIGTRESR